MESSVYAIETNCLRFCGENFQCNTMNRLFRSSKRARGEGSGLHAQVNEDFARVSARRVLPTRWADDAFLSSSGLRADFDLMCANAGISVLAYVERDSFDSLTWEFLSTFHDDLKEKGTQCMISFDLNH